MELVAQVLYLGLQECHADGAALVLAQLFERPLNTQKLAVGEALAEGVSGRESAQYAL